jgi:hypothetical protein
VIETTLTWPQVALGAQAGCMRYILALRYGRPELDGDKDLKWESHINGALGEMAVAQHLDCFWDPVWREIDRTRADVGRFHVRSTTARPGHLILHPRDPDDGRFYLVRLGAADAAGMALEIVGSILASEGKRIGAWEERVPGRGASYWVPADALA